MITASAGPGRDEQRHFSPSRTAMLKHDSCLKQLRDQSPRPTVQPVVSYGSHGAIITTIGPVRQHEHEHASRSCMETAVSPRHSPTASTEAATAAAAAATMSIGTSCDSCEGHDTAPQKASPTTAAGSGKRGQLESKPSITGSSLGTKRQVLIDHSATATDSSGSPKQHSGLLLPQPQQQQQQQQHDVEPESDKDEQMQDAVQEDQQYDNDAENVAPATSSMLSPFGAAVPLALQRSTGSPPRKSPSTAEQQQQEQQQQIQQQGSCGRPSQAAATAGQMLPPSSSGSFKRPSSGSPALQRAGSIGLAAAAAAAAAASSDSGQKHWSTEAAGLESSGPSISVSNGVITVNPAMSNAASLEGWLPGDAIAAAVAAAVAEQQQSGSPRSAAAAAAAAAALMRSSSTASSASIGRQGSLVFNPLAGAPVAHGPAAAAGSSLGRGSTATLESQGSFAGWPAAAAAAAGNSTTAAANNAAEGGFSWPKMPISRTLSEQQEALRRADSLALDIQVLAPVIPEEYPEQDPEDAEQQQHDIYQQQQQQHVEKAFFAKISSWESELVGMLEQQEAPLAIREIVAVFKDRISTERDKTEFKALCDKWTGVVEFPVGSGIKCLAIKSWMRDGAAAVAAAGGHGSGSSRGAAEPNGDYDDDVENQQP